MVAGCSGQVTFADSSANSPSSWTWDFADGSTSAAQNPVHNYSTAGTYNVQLIACNGSGCDSLSQTINVTNVVTADFTYSGQLVVGQSIQFADSSSGGTAWTWSFGDGTTSGMASPTHVYTSQGTYIVSLTVTGSGCTSVYTDTLQIVISGLENLGGANYAGLFPNPMLENATVQLVLKTRDIHV